MIHWNEPSFLDEQGDDRGERAASIAAAAHATPAESPAQQPAAPVHALDDADDDWIDRLDSIGLPELGSDPLSSPRRLPHVPAEPLDRFEVIWPSGEIDEQFDSTSAATAVDFDPDFDRVGRTVRIGSEPAAPQPTLPAPSIESTDSGQADEQADATDAIVLAVRRAVASIEPGTLDARRRLANDWQPAPHAPDAPVGLPDPFTPTTATSALPVRVVGQATATVVATAPESQVRVTRTTSRSVFDDDVVIPHQVEIETPTEPVAPPVPERVSALRRLIGSLRRH